MKRLLFMIMLVFLPLFAFAQGTEPPTDLVELWEWFKTGFATWPAALAVILVLTEKVKRMLNITGQWSVVLSWGLAVPLTFVAWYLKLGFLESAPWWGALIYAISFSLAANIAYLVPIIKEGVRILIDYFDKNKLAKSNKV
jgi:hypothetical protein